MQTHLEAKIMHQNLAVILQQFNYGKKIPAKAFGFSFSSKEKISFSVSFSLVLARATTPTPTGLSPLSWTVPAERQIIIAPQNDLAYALKIVGSNPWTVFWMDIF